MTIGTYHLDVDLLEVGNTKVLTVVDASTYPARPKDERLDVILPGTDSFVSLPFVANTYNSYNSNNLQLTTTLDEDKLAALPDGLYSFRYSICPNDTQFVEKQIMRITKITVDLFSLFAKMQIGACYASLDPRTKESILQVYLLLRGSQAEVNLGNAGNGVELFRKAQSILTTLTNKYNNCF